MRSLYRRNEKQVRFLLVGVWNTAFGYLTFAVLYSLTVALHMHYLAALAGSQCICIANAYISYKRIVFKTKGNYLAEFFRFTAVYWALFALNVAALPLLVGRAGMHPLAAQALIIAASVVASYAAHTLFTFGGVPRDEGSPKTVAAA
jgi:putative flippase GtrA